MTDVKTSTNPNDRDIINILKNAAESEGIKNFVINTEVGSVKGDGYVGIITSAQVLGKDEENKPTVLNLVVKSAKKSEALRDVVPMTPIFGREIYTYDTIFPAYRKFELEKGLHPSKFAPKFYKADKTEMSEALVLENLKEMGYRLYERRIPMDENHVKLVLEQYGRLHALSFALKDQNREEYEKLVSPLDDLFVKVMKHAKLFDGIIFRYKKCLEMLCPEADKKVLAVGTEFIDKIIPFYDSLLDFIEEYSAILHGDCWTNNMMFKYDENGVSNIPIKVDFLDFQIVRMGSPVLDLSYFFYACSDKDIIDNYEKYVRFYYDSFEAHLRKLGSDPEKLYPYKLLKEHWRKYAKFGFLSSVMVIHVMLSEKDETVDFAEIADSGENVMEAFNYDIANVDKYNERMKHLLFHFVENDFF